MVTNSSSLPCANGMKVQRRAFVASSMKAFSLGSALDASRIGCLFAPTELRLEPGYVFSTPGKERRREWRLTRKRRDRDC